MVLDYLRLNLLLFISTLYINKKIKPIIDNGFRSNTITIERNINKYDIKPPSTITLLHNNMDQIKHIYN